MNKGTENSQGIFWAKTAEDFYIRKEVSSALSTLINGEGFYEIAQELRFALLLAMENLIRQELKVLQLPSSLTAKERAFTHVIARLVGLHSESKRVNGERVLTIRRECSPVAQTTFLNSTTEFCLTWNSRNTVIQLLQTNPLTPKERLQLYPRVEGVSGLDKGTREERQRSTTGRLMGAVPQIPPSSSVQMNRELGDSTKQMIKNYRPQIIHYLNSSQVIIISGPPGCGKPLFTTDFVE
ncbi:unnamed protein product [Heterobilharzia americana]|nr:unnamed protein product [Heterobilharzia americana]